MCHKQGDCDQQRGHVEGEYVIGMGLGWVLDSEPTDSSERSTSDHATAKSTDEMIASSGVLPGKARKWVAARKKADHAMGRNRVVPGASDAPSPNRPKSQEGYGHFRIEI